MTWQPTLPATQPSPPPPPAATAGAGPIRDRLEPPLTQVAFSVVDLAATERWFREGLGFWPAGGSRRMMRGPVAASVQGLPRVASTCWWMVDRNQFFQLEMFQFERPLARLMPHDSTPCDIGYARIGVWVADFDQTLTRLRRLGSMPLSNPIGPAGARRACVRNPDGVYVELMEDDPLSGAGLAQSRSACPVAVRSVTVSVRDLARSEAFFSRGLGLERSDAVLRAPEHEALWGLAGARTRGSVFTAGNVLVELVQYLEPVGRQRPPGYRISDQGILNIAFGARSRRDHRTLCARARAAGARENRRPVYLPGAGVIYVNDPDQFSIELLWMSPASGKRWGFTPRPAAKRPRADTHSVQRTVRIAAPAQTTWDVIAKHETMPKWVGLGSVRRTVDGVPDPDGRGSERLLKFFGASITERVLAYEPPSAYRYHMTNGSPFICHHGEIRLRANGEHTELTWSIRFRPKLLGTGRPLAIMLSWRLGRVLASGLKPHVEAIAQRTPGTASNPTTPRDA
jgi:catechol 2,3-dioxygenase-like lactoylglutathione lyase family enzyme/uncharacterized protein YndB with AHSA1/START domain